MCKKSKSLIQLNSARIRVFFLRLKGKQKQPGLSLASHAGIPQGLWGRLWENLSYLFWEISRTGCLCEVPVHKHVQQREQEELEVHVQLQDYNFIRITGTWWDDWNTAMDGYRLFRTVVI